MIELGEMGSLGGVQADEDGFSGEKCHDSSSIRVKNIAIVTLQLIQVVIAMKNTLSIYQYLPNNLIARL